MGTQPLKDDTGTTFLDVLQSTPHLLKFLVATPWSDEDGQYFPGESGSDLKPLRLISRQARHAVLQAVTGCTLDLSTAADRTRNPVKMAQLLSTSPLRRLQLNFSVLEAELEQLSVWGRIKEVCTYSKSSQELVTYAHDPNEDHLLSGQLSAMISQLEEFVAAAQPGLDGVTSLELAFEFENPNGKDVANHPLSKAAGVEIVAILARACPNLKHVGFNAAVGKPALIKLGATCNFLRSICLLDHDFSAATLAKMFTLDELPNITDVSICTFLAAVQHQRYWSPKKVANSRALLWAVCKCQTLTRLDVGKQHLEQPNDWLVLPSSLKELRCYKLPVKGLPGNLVMAGLEKLELLSHEDAIGASQLLSLLTSAVHLHSLSTEIHPDLSVPVGKCWMNLQPCGLNAVQGLQLLSERLQAGLKLDHVPITSWTIYEETHDTTTPLISLQGFLPQLDPFPCCVFCSLTGGQVYACDVSQPNDPSALASIGTLFPGMEHLQLRNWDESDMQQLNASEALRKIECFRLENIPQAAFVQALVRMPWVEKISHSARAERNSTQKLRAQLLAAHIRISVSSGGCDKLDPDILKQLNQWVVSCDRGGIETWSNSAQISFTVGGSGGVLEMSHNLQWCGIFKFICG